MRWVWRGITGGTLVLGWLFILWQNNFHITTPVVFIGLGYLALVLGVGNLWRVGAAAVAPEDESREAWSRPIGARGELDKEKKTLLKAIKEAEFDLAMGKLSKADADDLIRTYRSRAIAVIKELDRLDAGAAGTAREQIQREVQARLAIDAAPAKRDKRAKQTAAKVETKAKTPVVVETKPVDTSPVETDPVKTTDDVETHPVHTNADDTSPEDVAADAAAQTTKSTEATS